MSVIKLTTGCKLCGLSTPPGWPLCHVHKAKFFKCNNEGCDTLLQGGLIERYKDSGNRTDLPSNRQGPTVFCSDCFSKSKGMCGYCRRLLPIGADIHMYRAPDRGSFAQILCTSCAIQKMPLRFTDELIIDGSEWPGINALGIISSSKTWTLQMFEPILRSGSSGTSLSTLLSGSGMNPLTWDSLTVSFSAPMSRIMPKMGTSMEPIEIVIYNWPGRANSTFRDWIWGGMNLSNYTDADGLLGQLCNRPHEPTAYATFLGMTLALVVDQVSYYNLPFNTLMIPTEYLPGPESGRRSEAWLEDSIYPHIIRETPTKNEVRHVRNMEKNSAKIGPVWRPPVIPLRPHWALWLNEYNLYNLLNIEQQQLLQQHE